jgi:ketosteroid isomerase-like protein
MPSERIERLVDALAQFERTGEAPTGFLAPDFELHQASSIVDTAGVFRGRDALRHSLDELSESFGELTFEPRRFLEAPGGEVVMLVHARARGRASGMEVDNDIAWVWTFRGRQAVRLVVYEEAEHALEAVGLTP